MEEQHDISKNTIPTKDSNIALRNKYSNTFTDIVVGQQSENSLIIKEVLHYLEIVAQKLFKWIYRYKSEILILFFVSIGIFGCLVLSFISFNYAKNSPIPNTPVPFQASPTLKKPTPSPTNIKLPTTVPYKGLTGCVSINQLSIRKGPGIEYDIIGYLYEGNCFLIFGRSADNNWLLIVDDSSSIHQWVSSQFIVVEGDLHLLHVIKE